MKYTVVTLIIPQATSLSLCFREEGLILGRSMVVNMVFNCVIPIPAFVIAASYNKHKSMLYWNFN